MEPIFVDISGRYRQNLYIGALKASASQISDVLDSRPYLSLMERYGKIPTYKELRRKEEVESLIDILDKYGLEYSIGIFKRKEYVSIESKIRGKWNYKARLMSIFIYLTTRGMVSYPEQLVYMEEGEYPSWRETIRRKLSEWHRSNILLKIDSKYLPGLLVADHLSGFGRRSFQRKISNINRNRLFIASSKILKFYVKEEFKIRI